MALIKCVECGKEISDTLKTCPNCGIEIKKKNVSIKEKKKFNGIDIGLIILLSIYSLCSLPNILPLSIQTFYNITYISILWLLFFAFKTKRSILKIVISVVLVLNVVLYLLLDVRFNLRFFGLIGFIRLFLNNYIPYIFLYVILLKGESNGNN